MNLNINNLKTRLEVYERAFELFKKTVSKKKTTICFNPGLCHYLRKASYDIFDSATNEILFQVEGYKNIYIEFYAAMPEDVVYEHYYWWPPHDHLVRFQFMEKLISDVKEKLSVNENQL